MHNFGHPGTHHCDSSVLPKTIIRCLCMFGWLILSLTASAATPPCTLNTVDPSVTICTPAPNATVSSPVHVVAGTTSSKTVTFTQIYVDGVKATQVSGGTIDASVSMSAGTHRLTVQAYNGAWFKATEYLTVQ